jgi:hypothetical protein
MVHAADISATAAQATLVIGTLHHATAVTAGLTRAGVVTEFRFFA